MCANFFFRMCGALKEGIEVVIKGRASGNDWRKFVGRQRDQRFPQRWSRTEGVTAHPTGP